MNHSKNSKHVEEKRSECRGQSKVVSKKKEIIFTPNLVCYKSEVKLWEASSSNSMYHFCQQNTVMGTVHIQFSRSQSREYSLYFSCDVNYPHWCLDDSQEITRKCADHPLDASWHLRFPSDVHSIST